MKQTTGQWLAVLALVFGFAACAPLPNAKSTMGRNPQVAEIPGADETVRGEEDPPIVTLELGSSLHARRLSETEELPGNIIIPTTNLDAVPITAALQAVLAGTDVSLSWDTGTLGDRLVTVMNLSGPLPKVVNKICAAARVFCAFRHGSLELQDRETFIVGLPPMAKSPTSSGSGNNSMAETISQIVGSKVQVDDQGGNIIYTADVDAQSRIEKYLEELRNGRPLVVIQMYIWEVKLNKQNTTGINWSALKLGDLGPGFSKLDLSSVSNFAGPKAATAITSGGVSLGAITTGRLNANALATFLSTQGQVQTISSPQVTFVSGSSAQFKVGGKQRYISQVGQLVTANNTSGTTNPNTTTGVGSNTVNTDSIDTGLTVAISGAYENGVVFANLDLTLTNLISLNPTQSGGGIINLPETTDEKIATSIRVRPGDNLVMAGMVSSKDNSSRQGIPLGSDSRIPTYGDNQYENRELVIVMKPSVVLFSDSAMTAAAKKKNEGKPLPDAVLIDKDGAQTLALPPARNVPPPPLPPQAMPAVPVRPELMASEPAPQPTAPVPLTPSADGAPVDRRMMQRGFSHAFDELLQDGSNVAERREGKL
ncbi:MAG: hypothetical protein SFW62_00595 [Alphaproteobacteria bacterium]|nr:hypothetical protein [Alphaproteobacteria bacterium]